MRVCFAHVSDVTNGPLLKKKNQYALIGAKRHFCITVKFLPRNLFLFFFIYIIYIQSLKLNVGIHIDISKLNVGICNVFGSRSFNSYLNTYVT